MAIYVDDLRQTTPTARWPYTLSCHLTADTHDELMAAAKRLFLQPGWIQREGTWQEHFDLTAMMRSRAVEKLGAVEEDWRTSAQRLSDRRRNATTNEMQPLGEAIASEGEDDQ